MSFNRLPYDVNAYQQQLNESVGPMDYMLNVPTGCDQCYPNDPSVRIQKSGASTVGGTKFQNVDVESELKGQTRQASKCPTEQFMSDCEQPDLTHYKDCVIASEETRTTNPACNLRGTGWNRWEWLCLNPQDKVAFDNHPNGRVPFDADVSVRRLTKDNHRPCLPTPLDQTLCLPSSNFGEDYRDAMSCDKVDCEIERVWEVPTVPPSVAPERPSYPNDIDNIMSQYDMNPMKEGDNMVNVEPVSIQWRYSNLQAL